MANASILLAGQERKAVGALTVDNPRQQARLGVVADLSEQIIRRRDKIPEGVEGQGDPLLDELRAVARDMEKEERGLLALRNAESERRFRQTKVSLSCGGALAADRNRGRLVGAARLRRPPAIRWRHCCPAKNGCRY